MNTSGVPGPADISLKASVHPTEEEDRVRTAILNIFPDTAFEPEEDHEGLAILYGIASDLETFSTRLRDQMIRNTARGVLWHCISGRKMTFYLNKQAAFVGKVNFAEGDSTLGDIEVRIGTDEPEALLDSLTSTVKEDEE